MRVSGTPQIRFQITLHPQVYVPLPNGSYRTLYGRYSKFSDDAIGTHLAGGTSKHFTLGATALVSQRPITLRESRNFIFLQHDISIAKINFTCLSFMHCTPQFMYLRVEGRKVERYKSADLLLGRYILRIYFQR